MRNRALIVAFLLGLACVVAAASLAAGDDPPPAGEVTSLDQLRGVSFLSRCGFSHRAPDDPIVAPGRPGSSHDHTFIGSRETNAFSTDATLRAAASTCRRRGETAAYWVPTLLAGGQPVLPAAVSIYYRRTTLSEVTPFPPGFRLIAGSSTATTPQSQTITYWNCGIEAPVPASSEPPTCPPGPRTALRLHIAFGQCWDGHNLDSPNHKTHVTYAIEGVCPPSHPVALPQIELIARYQEFSGTPTLSSGGVYSAHADFINTWDEGRLDGLVTDCLNGLRFCGGGG